MNDPLKDGGDPLGKSVGGKRKKRARAGGNRRRGPGIDVKREMKKNPQQRRKLQNNREAKKSNGVPATGERNWEEESHRSERGTQDVRKGPRH